MLKSAHPLTTSCDETRRVELWTYDITLWTMAILLVMFGNTVICSFYLVLCKVYTVLMKCEFILYYTMRWFFVLLWFMSMRNEARGLWGCSECPASLVYSRPRWMDAAIYNISAIWPLRGSTPCWSMFLLMVEGAVLTSHLHTDIMFSGHIWGVLAIFWWNLFGPVFLYCVIISIESITLLIFVSTGL